MTDFLQALAERGHHVRVRLGRRAAQESDHRHRRLLRTRSKRPRSRCTAKKRDELASLHVPSREPRFVPMAKG